MPVVPTSRGPSVEAAPIRITAPTPEVYSTAREAYQQARGVDPNAFGAQLAEVQMQGAKQLGQAADQISLLATKMQIEENEREVKRLSNEFAASRHIIGYGDGTPENRGYYATNGENAVAGAGAAKEAIKKERERLMASASNARVRQLFEERANADTTEEHGRIDRFVLKEREVAEDLASNGRMAAATSDMALYPNDASVRAKSDGIIVAETLQWAERKGVKDETVVAQMIRKNRTPGVQGAINSALAMDSAEGTALAQQILKENQSKIEGTQVADLAEKILSKNVDSVAQSFAAQAQAAHPGDIVAQRKWIQENTSGKTESKTLELLNGEIAFARGIQSHALSLESAARARRNDADAKEEKKARGLAQSVSDDAATKYPDPAQAVEKEAYIKGKLSDNPIARDMALERARADNQVKNQVRILAEHQATVEHNAAKRAVEEQKQKDARDAAAALEGGGGLKSLSQETRQRMTANGQMTSFMELEKKKAKGDFEPDPAYYDKIRLMTDSELLNSGITALDIQANLGTQGHYADYALGRLERVFAGKDDPNGAYSETAVLRPFIEQLGLDQEGKGKERGRLRMAYTDAIALAEKKNGRKVLSPEERKEIAKALTAEVAVQRWGSNPRLYNSEGKTLVVPAQDRKEIVESFVRKQKRQPSAQEISDIYRKDLLRQAAGVK